MTATSVQHRAYTAQLSTSSAQHRDDAASHTNLQNVCVDEAQNVHTYIPLVSFMPFMFSPCTVNARVLDTYTDTNLLHVFSSGISFNAVSFLSISG